MEFFTSLGLAVEELWRRQDYQESAFPDVAVRALTEAPPCEHLSLWDLVRWACLCDPIPLQLDLGASFGQPPLTVFHGRDFHIEVLFWTTGLPSIHQHSFSGAFHVMHGSSLHALWEFAERERIGTRLLFGDVRFREAELLETGAIRPIVAGRDFIHSTFHLELPSVSVVVRTNNESGSLPQYLFLPPSIAHAAQEVPATIKRRAQILDMLGRAGRMTELSELIKHTLEHADAFAAFVYIRELWPMLEKADQRDSILAAASRKHPLLIEKLRPALANSDRRDRITGLRNSIMDLDVRFFLAVVLNLPDLDSITILMRRKYPSLEPLAVIAHCISQICSLGLLGSDFDNAWDLVKPYFQNVLISDGLREKNIGHAGALEAACRLLQNHWLLHSMWAPRH